MARAGMVLTCLQSQLAIGKGNSNYNYTITIAMEDGGHCKF